MKRRYSILVLSMVLCLILSCNIAGNIPATDTDATGEATLDSQAAIDQAVAETMTAIAGVPSVGLDVTPTFTPSLEGVTVSVSVDTNCRTGPGTAYDILGALLVGQTADVVGRSANSDNWIIQLPSNPAIICWVWGQYATAVGDTSQLPIFDTPPTPTPSISFTVSYVGLVGPCGGGQYTLRFLINNTGSLTWESVRLDIVDNTTATTLTHQRDFFRSFLPGCSLGDFNYNFEPGESGETANVNPGQFTYDPTGHSITATITVCETDGMGGQCMSKTLNITP